MLASQRPHLLPCLARAARRDAAIRLALVLLPLMAYQGVRACGFVNYDDTGYVTANHRVLQGLSFDNVVWVFTHEAMGNWHPVTMLSHMLDCELFGASAAAHHLVSLVLHVVNGVLLFELLARTTKAPYRSAAVATLFALHPAHVESVAWVSERKDVLSALFWLLTLHVYVGWVRDRRGIRYFALVVTFALGLLCKPMLVTLPFVLVLFDVWPLARVEQWHKRVVEKAPLLGLAIVLMVITFAAQRRAGAVSSLEALPLAARASNALVAYVRYLGETVWPANLSVYYPFRRWSSWHVAGAGALLVAISALLLKTHRQRPYLLIGWLLYLGQLVPVLGIVQVGAQSMADRYLYLPSVGLFLMGVWGIADALALAPRRAPLLAVTTTAAFAACLLATHAQVARWRSSFTLFEHAAAATHHNWQAHNHLGLAFAEVGELDAAIGHYQRALSMQPAAGSVHTNLAVALATRGQTASAIEHFQRALALDGARAEAHYNLGNAWLHAGDVERAVAECTIAVQISPDDPAAHYNLGTALAASGAADRAADEFRRVIKLDPYDANAENNLGAVLAGRGQLHEALEHFHAARRIDPTLQSAAKNAAAAAALTGAAPPNAGP